MKKMICLCVLLLLALSAAFASAQATQEQRLEDIAALCDGLKAGHMNLFARVSEEAFDAARAELETRLDGMTDGEFDYALMALAALAGDAHTSLSYTQSKYARLTALPFAVTPMDGVFRLAMIEESGSAYLGFEVTAINGVPMQEVFERAKAYISHDTDAWARRQFSNTINFLEGLQAMGVAAADASGVTLSLRAESGETAQYDAAGMSESEIMQAKMASLQPAAYANTWASGYYRALQLDEKTIFVQYNVCQQAPDMDMGTFAQLVRPYLEAEAVTRLVVDLRYNTGGDSRVMEPLLAMIGEVQAEKRLEVYTLIGNDTFSSAVINAVQTVERLGAVLVGEETGGSVNAYGELQSFLLPHAPLCAYYSTKHFELMPGYAGDSLLPDLPAAQTFEDYMLGRDTAVNTVLAL